jgi:SAM-dependent methyltransferase
MRASILTWEFSRGKLRGDPLYRSTVCGGLLPSGGTLVDIGCGNGLTLAILAEAQTRFKEGRWPATWNPPPQFDCLIGIEVRARPVGVAREALGSDATIIHGDARTTNVGPCRVVLLFDVLHMLGPSEQEALLAAVSASLEPGGVALIREADASGGWRFAAVRFGNRVKALAFGHWRQPFDFRTTDEWLACFASHGLAGQVRPMSAGTPFANVLFRVTVSAPVSATIGRP